MATPANLGVQADWKQALQASRWRSPNKMTRIAYAILRARTIYKAKELSPAQA